VTEYTRASPTGQVVRAAAVTSVDAINQLATMTTRDLIVITVDTSYYVGAVQVTPTVGDQWQVEKVNGNWRLKSQLPFNTPNDSAITPTAGQHVVGSGQGPIEMQGTRVNINAPLVTQAVPTTGRPAASSVPAGTQIYDATLNKPIWSNGSAWHDATGATV
jgi:hypothetical protein